MPLISMKQTERNVKTMIHKLSSSNSPLLPDSSCFPDCTLPVNPELDLKPGDKSSVFCAEGILGMRTSDIFRETATLVLKKKSKKITLNVLGCSSNLRCYDRGWGVLLTWAK